MKFVPYSAVDGNGKLCYGYGNGDSNAEVLQKLKQEGLSEIKLFGDAFLDMDRPDLEGISGALRESNAKQEIDNAKGITLLSHIKFNLSTPLAIGFIAFGLLLLALGIYIDSIILMIIAILVTLWMPFQALLSYVLVSDFNTMFKANALGDWDGVYEKLDVLYGYGEGTFPQYVSIELDKISAKLLAIESDPRESFAIVERKYGFLEKLSPLAYSILLVEVHYINGDYQKSREQLIELDKKYPNNATIKIDVALSEAKFGDMSRAKEIMNEIDIYELPQFVLPIAYLIEGMFYQESDRTKAMQLFEHSLSLLREYEENPSTWIPLAMTTAHYAVALYDHGEKKRAEYELGNVWHVLQVHGDKPLLDSIYERFPEFRE